MGLGDFRALLIQLADRLQASGEHRLEEACRSAGGGSDADLERFLVSDDMWGGSGSIADQAGLDRDGRSSAHTRGIEEKLAELGKRQISAGLINRRTPVWTEAFRRGRKL